jgi:hypothetical protein
MNVLFLLLCAHALCDFALQPEAMGNGKSRRRHLRGDFGVGFPPWYAWLGAHAFIHGGAVALITGSWLLGLLEAAVHALIDHAKCEERISFGQDQLLHIVCKAGYAWVLLDAGPLQL